MDNPIAMLRRVLNPDHMPQIPVDAYPEDQELVRMYQNGDMYYFENLRDTDDQTFRQNIEEPYNIGPEMISHFETDPDHLEGPADYPEVYRHDCSNTRVIQEYKAMTGEMGMRLAEAIDSLDIVDSKYSVNTFGFLMYYLSNFFAHKRSQFGEKISPKLFNQKELAEKFKNSTQIFKKVTQFIKDLPDFKTLQQEIVKIYEKDKHRWWLIMIHFYYREAAKYKNDFISRSLLRINDHAYELLCIKIILDCYYLYYTYIEGIQSKILRKKVFPLQLKFYKIIDKIDPNLI